MNNTDTIAQHLLDQMDGGRSLHAAYSSRFDQQYKINGKYLKEWDEHFRISIDGDLDPRKCISLSTHVMELHQEATNYKSNAEAKLSSMKHSYQNKYRRAFAALVDLYKEKKEKLPAKDTLAALAEDQVSSISDAVIHAEIELAFWKDILVDLANCRKHLDMATINLSAEAKALANDKYLDALNRRER